ncbi:unnamed protein product, partial [Prorocentrum cordatum]
DDPITYVTVGCTWPSGRPRHCIEAQLSRRIASVLAEDPRAPPTERQTRPRGQKQRGSSYVDEEQKHPGTHPTTGPGRSGDRAPARARHSAEELDAHYRRRGASATTHGALRGLACRAAEPRGEGPRF